VNLIEFRNPDALGPIVDSCAQREVETTRIMMIRDLL